MFVARRDIQNVGKDNKVVLYRSGDPIPDFKEWGELAQRTLLKNKWVTEEPDTAVPVVDEAPVMDAAPVETAPTPKKAKKKSVTSARK